MPIDEDDFGVAAFDGGEVLGKCEFHLVLSAFAEGAEGNAIGLREVPGSCQSDTRPPFFS